MKTIKILFILLIISFTFSIFLISAESMLYSPDFYKKEFNKNSAIKDTDTAIAINNGLLLYYMDKKDIPLVFTASEKSHLEDVKQLIKRARSVLIFLTLLNIALISLILANSEKLNKDISNFLIYSGIIGLIMFLPLLLSTFSNVFVKFHLIFFSQGNWQFSQDSILITLYPLQFFYDYALKTAINSATIFIILIVIGYFLSRHSGD